MINFNVGALRPATDDARLERIAAANDLVRRTLAQHGLMPNPPIAKTGAVDLSGSAIESLLSGLQSRHGKSGPVNSPIPEGAQFHQDRFSCHAGRRSYRTYVPASAADGVTGIVVMLHGCTQTPEKFAVGTGMNALAEKYRFVVVYPQQSRGDNAQSCWNWFSRGDQRRDRGEPAILAGLTQKVMTDHGVSKERTFVAGLSAGAAMAVILGETYPDVFAGVGAHSGLPFGAAADVPSAFAAMAGNVQGNRGPRSTGTGLRTIIFHGTADATVHPSNGERIARQALDNGSGQTIATEEQGSASGRSFTRSITASSEGMIELEHWAIDGLGHAWSGGQSAGSYADAKGPDASAEMIRFFFNAADKDI